MGRFKNERGVAIVGYGQSQLYRRAPVPLASLAIDAARKAIADSGIDPKEINGISTYPLLPAGAAHTNEDGQDIVTTGFMAAHLGLETRWQSDTEGGGQIGGALLQAVNAIAAGSADTALVFRALHNPPGRYHAFKSNTAPGPRQWSATYGLAGPPSIVGMPYREYVERYGATADDMATLVVQIRENVQNNPLAYWKGTPLTREDYLQARIIGEPIRIFDCDIPIDGAAAFIVTTADRARDLPHKPVYIAGFAQGTSSRRLPTMTLDSIYEAGLRTGKALWEHAGVKPAEIDCPQLYDGFTPITYFWLESLGFCPVGEAHNFIQDGRIAIDGKFPLLSGGGNQGNGRLHGVPHIRENYLQLSGRAGERQLKKATLGVSSHSFPVGGSALVYSAERLS